MCDMTQKIKRIVILGNRGFIGKKLTDYFSQKQNGVEVIGLDFPEYDLTSESVVEKMVEFLKPTDAVVLLSMIKRQFGDNLDNFHQNVKMAAQVCRAIERQPIARLIYFSSTAVYGEDVHNMNITEETAILPTSYYGMAKYVSERLLWKTFENIPGGSYLAVRPPTIYGTGDQGDTYGPVKFANCLEANKKIVLWGDGTELREFLWIGDLAEIIFRLLLSGDEGVVNVANGERCSFKEILEHLQKMTGRDIAVEKKERTKNKVDNAFDNQKLMMILNGYKFTSLAEGLNILCRNLKPITNCCL